jgi:Domain of unknown function (DUF5666)
MTFLAPPINTKEQTTMWVTTSRVRPAVRAAALGAVVLATLAVAGSSAGAAGTTTGGNPGRTFPGAVGSVAAISGSSMEVQNPETGQTTVEWTADTTFTQTESVSIAAVAKGDCVTITGTSAKKAITAKTVAISTPPASGTCPGIGGVPGGGLRGPYGTPPQGSFAHRGTFPKRGTFPNHGSGTHKGFDFRGIGFAGGKVTRVATKTMTISGFSSASFSKPKKTKSKKSSSSTSSKSHRTARPKATTVHVKVTSSTTYTEVQAATAANLADGDCVTASGTSASNGTISASTIRITSSGGQSCTSGFGAIAGAAPGAGVDA